MVALITSLIKWRCTAYRNLCLLRRPLPEGGVGIGPWQSLLEIIEVIAVVMNAAFAIFVMHPLKDLGMRNKWLLFITTQYVVIALKLLVRSKYPSTPRDVEDSHGTNNAVVRKCLTGYKVHEIAAERAMTAIPEVGPRAFT